MPYYGYHNDSRGSTTNILDDYGNVVKSYDYEAYGNTAAEGDSGLDVSIAFTGAVLDEETGLYYMNARYYDPATGRFISQDSYRGTGEEFWHLYAYCDGDPVNHTDPTGHAAVEFFYDASDKYIKKYSNLQITHLKKKGYEVEWQAFSGTKSFTSVWNNSAKSLDIVIIYSHSSPTNMQYVDISTLNYKSIKTLVLFGCNSGHKDTYNAAEKFIKKHKNKGIKVDQIIAADGLIYPIKDKTSFKIGAGDKDSSFNNNASNKKVNGKTKREPEGFRHYKNGKWQKALGKSFDSMAALLKAAGR